VLCAALTVPVVFALTRMGPADRAPVDPETGHAAQRPPAERRKRCGRPSQIFLDKNLLAFAVSAALFFLGSAAVLPIAVNELTTMYGDAVGLWLSASIVVPQIVVASLSPWIGRAADRLGRRPVLLLGFIHCRFGPCSSRVCRVLMSSFSCRRSMGWVAPCSVSWLPLWSDRRSLGRHVSISEPCRRRMLCSLAPLARHARDPSRANAGSSTERRPEVGMSAHV
jgi:hypothetical protein